MSTQMLEIDLSVDHTALRAPGAGQAPVRVKAAVEPDGTATVTTTCWSCGLTCSGCTSDTVCSDCDVSDYCTEGCDS
jgi:hypothetical protein